MKISEIKGERGLDIIADIMEIFGDDEVNKAFQGGKNGDAIVLMMRKHKAATLDMLAAINGVEAKDYNTPVTAVMGELTDVLSDPDFINLFTSQGTSETEIRSSSASENTEGR